MSPSVLFRQFRLKEKRSITIKYQMEATNRETWKSINGFANYEISSCGRVRNAKTERILKPQDNGQGYLRVGIYKNKKRVFRQIHVLSANAFIENPHNKPFVDHIDGNSQNNCIENLRFATRAENNRNARKTTSKTSSVYKGVYLNKSSNKWAAYIDIHGVRTHLGLFKIEREAAEAYNAAAVEYYKEFARLNTFAED